MIELISVLPKGSSLVKEKQLMCVARVIGQSWKEIGRMALDIPSVKLEHIEEDNSRHVERVFAMLRYWCARQREKATAANLHSLLCQGDWNIGDIEFLVDSDWSWQCLVPPQALKTSVINHWKNRTSLMLCCSKVFFFLRNNEKMPLSDQWN